MREDEDLADGSHSGQAFAQLLPLLHLILAPYLPPIRHHNRAEVPEDEDLADFNQLVTTTILLLNLKLNLLCIPHFPACVQG